MNFGTVSRSFDAEFYSGHDFFKIELRTESKNRKRSMFLKSSKTNFDNFSENFTVDIFENFKIDFSKCDIRLTIFIQKSIKIIKNRAL